MLYLKHVLADRQSTTPDGDLDQEDLDDEKHDEVAASGVEDHVNEEATNANDSLSMGSDGEL